MTIGRMKELYFAIQCGGGFSVDAQGKRWGNGGYAVGSALDSKHFLIGKSNSELSYNTLQKTLTELSDILLLELPLSKRFVIGGWVSKDDRVYVEVSEVFSDIKDAIEVGLQRKEIAIWDFNNNREIPLRID